MFRILVADELGQAGLERLKQAEDASFDMMTGLDKETLLGIVPAYEALIVRSGTQVDADVLQAGSKLRVVGRAGVGVDNIDIPAASRMGIIVMNTPGANSIATAEQAMTLMQAISRHTASAHASLKAGEWKRAAFVGTELYGKTLGLVGCGRVGRLVAERALAFGMEVLAYDPFVSEEVALELGVTLVDLEDLLPEADYISLHTALLPETESMINAESISLMKEGVIIVNAARGKLIDDDALAGGLKSGKVRAAAIDVYRQEPPSADNPLLGLPNVLHTPHLGASTTESQHKVATQIADQVLAALRGTDFANALNMPFQISEGNFGKIQPFMKLAEKLGALHAGLANKQVRHVEVEVQGDEVRGLVRAIAAAILIGLLRDRVDVPINYINAPVLAEEHGITINQARGIKKLDYPNLITCRASWDGGERTLGGVLFGGSEPRIVQVDQYRLEARPEGVVLMLKNQDVPGVIGQVGTMLAEYKVNIAEWRLGRNEPGGEALSFINLDSEPPTAVLEALAEVEAVTRVKVAVL
ncbi:MAG: phosphoglycerate dehydrogenase [Chloroflexi bacterium]|jgi:D-3-phosphoglycerate dehydrogenase|nr:phosphoglycerate dehydrogenase [Chloroflexota bacterium]